MCGRPGLWPSKTSGGEFCLFLSAADGVLKFDIMITHSSAVREEVFQLELEQIHRNARMRMGVVWAFIFVSIGRGFYEYISRQGSEGLAEGVLYAVIPAVILGVMGFPLVNHYARKAEAKLRARFSEQPRRRP